MSIIKNLKLKNFKSFKKADIPFAKGFTAIAGANASGKSNILDAILFAMGITSLKQLRVSRLTELVNHDSKEGYAKVELIITDDNGTDLNVTRIIDKQGKSIYKLDDKRKTLNEIQSLLLELGINPNGHNIVVQGDITKVIEMNAKQRRQVIEEVAGLQEFEEKKEEAIKKLDKVQQKVKDANLVLNEREEYLEKIEEEKESALRYKELQEEMKRAKATILGEEIKIIRKELDFAHKNLGTMQKEIEDKRKERDSLQEEERELEVTVEEATTKLINASEQTYSGLGKEVEQLKGQINLINERLKSKNSLIETKTNRIRELKEKSKETRERREEKNEALKNAGDALEKINSQLETVRKVVYSKTPKFEEKKDGVESKEINYISLGKETEDLKEKLHELRIKKNDFEKDVKNAEELVNELTETKKVLEEKLAKKNELDHKIKVLNVKSPGERLETKEQELEKLISKLHSKKGKIESLDESLESLDKAKAECPVCDLPLDGKRKEEIESHKKTEIGKLNGAVNQLNDEKEQIMTQKRKIRAEKEEFDGLVHLIKAFQGLEGELRNVKEKLISQKEIIGAKKTPKLQEEENILKSKIGELEKKRNVLEDAIQEFKKSSANTEMSEIVQKFDELNQQKNEKQQLYTELKSEVELVIADRLESFTLEETMIEKELKDAKEQANVFEEEKKKEEKKLNDLETELEKANKANKLLEEEKERLTTKIKNISEKRETLGIRIENQEKEMNETNLQQSKNEVRIVDLEEEFKEYYNVKPFREFVLNDLKNRIPEIEKETEKLGAINMKALEDFDRFKKEVDDVRGKANKLDEERLAVVEMIDKIEVRKLNVFMECFDHVAKKFSELYFQFFEGEGHLDLSDKEEPLKGGLLIQAKYKEDIMKSIDAMSGGEKSLTALAFLFAIQSFDPAPFYIFDEVDAALDKENSIKVGKMISGQAKTSQFISISHNDSVINHADQIIGVALNKQKSSVIGLKLKKEEKSAQSLEIQ